MAEKSDSGKHNCCYCTRFTTVHPTLDSVGGVGGVTHCQSLYQWLKDHQRSIAQGHSTIHSLTCYLSISLSLFSNLSLAHSITRDRLPLPAGRPCVLDHLGNLFSPAHICPARNYFHTLLFAEFSSFYSFCEIRDMQI